MSTSAIKKLIFALAAIGVVGLLVLYTLWRTSPMQLGKEAFDATGLPVRTYAEAQAMASAQNKPILIDFSAYWCPSCRLLDRKVLSDDAVKQKIEEQYVFVRIDSEAEGTREHMKRYNLHGYPSLVVVDAEGNLIRHLPRNYDADKFLRSL